MAHGRARHANTLKTPMTIHHDLVICEHCDAVYQRRALARGQVASCTNCLSVIYQAQDLNVRQRLALSVTAAIAFLIANICPVITINLHGLESHTTMWQAALALAQGDAAPIAVPTAAVAVLVPLLQIVILIWVLAFARSGQRAPGFAPAMKMLNVLRPWSMVEVCVLGILVAVIKLSSLVQVYPGAGVWATAVLMVLMTLIAGRDVSQLWTLTQPQPQLQPSAEPA
jgi:paraquat-inducible protein A